MNGQLHGATAPEGPRRAALALFADGFLAMLPLWAGAIPIGTAYGVAARGAGLSPAETQLMSLVVFSAAAQVSAVSLLAVGVPGLVLVGTAMALNVQLLLVGLAVGRQVRPSLLQRLAAAWFLTDGAYAIASARGPMRLPTLLGAGVSMYLGWNAGTGLGTAAGHGLPDLERYGIDFVVPLTFLAVLVPLLRTRTASLVALAAAVATPLLAWLAPGGVAVLGAGVLGSAVGAWWTGRARGITPGQDEAAR